MYVTDSGPRPSLPYKWMVLGVLVGLFFIGTGIYYLLATANPASSWFALVRTGLLVAGGVVLILGTLYFPRLNIRKS